VTCDVRGSKSLSLLPETCCGEWQRECDPGGIIRSSIHSSFPISNISQVKIRLQVARHTFKYMIGRKLNFFAIVTVQPRIIWKSNRGIEMQKILLEHSKRQLFATDTVISAKTAAICSEN
jgi:hypothetical protein